MALETLSECLKSRVAIWVTCDHHTCPDRAKSKRLDLRGLIAAHGDLTVDQLRARLKCQSCGKSGAISLVTGG